MRKFIWLGLVVLGVGLAAALGTHGMGFTARASPSSFEGRLMRGARRWGIPATVRGAANPVAPTDAVLHEAMAHWADHCATCHGNDGGGHTPIGRSLYPPAPDMRAAETEHLTDGELFYVIERGVPFTGMPAWGNGTADGERESWALVHLIRHLPKLSDKDIEDMEKLNPRSAAQIGKDKRIDDFLKGKDGR
jgi:mono/diheme cytochrome c family protein